MMDKYKRKPKTKNSHLARTSDVAESVDSQIKFRTRANKSRSNLLKISVPIKLHSQHIRICGPLRKNNSYIQCFRQKSTVLLYCIRFYPLLILNTHRAIKTMAVVIQEPLFLIPVKLQPVVKTRHLTTLNFPCCKEKCYGLHTVHISQTDA